MKIGKYEFDIDKNMYVMGILNVTPDSFSDGGKYNQIDQALIHVEQMLEDGATIIDVGGESTRPGYDVNGITIAEEISRVVPVIKEIKSRFDVAISLDTYHAETAQAGIEAGADLINDIWGLKYDSKMAEVIAKGNVSCCLMHNRKEAVYDNYLCDVKGDLEECISLAKNAGIADDKIMIDPGVGFGKTFEQNLLIMKHLEELNDLGYPILLGTSRKSMIGNALNLPVGERVEGTLATSVIGKMKGCAFVRVHDVKENIRAIRMTEAIMYAGE